MSKVERFSSVIKAMWARDNLNSVSADTDTLNAGALIGPYNYNNSTTNIIHTRLFAIIKLATTHEISDYMTPCSSVISSYLLGGGDPPESPRKTQKIQKTLKKCIEFTPQICVSPQNLESRINTARVQIPHCLIQALTQVIPSHFPGLIPTEDINFMQLSRLKTEKEDLEDRLNQLEVAGQDQECHLLEVRELITAQQKRDRDTVAVS